jgi:hypothetical protein
MKNSIAACLTAVAVTGVVWSMSANAQHTGVLYGIKAVEGQLIARSLDLSDSGPGREYGKLNERTDERLTAIFQRKDRGIGAVRTLVKPRSQYRASVRLLGIPERLINASSTDVTGLSSSYSISSVLVPESGPPLALIAHHSDTPPFWLANVNLDSGKIDIIGPTLNPMIRYSHLAQCPNARIYAVSMAPQYDVRMVQLDLDRQQVLRLAQIKLDGDALHTAIKSLACGATGILYGLADPTFSGSNSLFTIEPASGTMTLLRPFDVDRMIFVR